MDQIARQNRLEELARLAKAVAEASGQSWEYAAVVIHLAEGVPALVPVVVTVAGADARTGAA